MRNDFVEDNRNNTLDYFTEKHIKTANGELNEIMHSAQCGTYVVPTPFGKKVSRTRWFKEKVYSRTPLFVRLFLYF